GLPARLGLFVDWREARAHARAALAAVGDPVSPRALAGGLSPAQRQLVEIGAAVAQAASVLVLDEPTSSLSPAEVEALVDHLRQSGAAGAATVYVSHRFEELFALADEVTVLRDGARVWHGAIGDTSPEQLIRHMVGRPVTAAPPREERPLGPVRLAC